MIKAKSSGTLAGAGVLSAIAASLCCIMPVLALFAGSGSMASAFSWMEPFRPYLIGITIAFLGIVWYRKLKPRPADNCGCMATKKTSFLQSRAFLLLVTLFSVLMITFPYYANALFLKNKIAAGVMVHSKNQTIVSDGKAMNCEAMEAQKQGGSCTHPGTKKDCCQRD
jgi:hypothetical protein